jgi:glutamate:GABA antiporter
MVSVSSNPRRVLSVFVLAMLNVSMMASLRNLPLVADYGLSAVIYFSIVGLIFLVPSALVSAELATGWPKTGGVYIWIREALGDRWGFFGIYMQWVHNVAWYPAILTFVATTLAYVFDPELAKNKGFILWIILGSFWGMTLYNYLGIKTSSWFSAIGVIAGTLFPGAMIIILGFLWIAFGNPLHIELSFPALAPELSSITNLVFLAGLFLAFGGLEVSAVHAADVKDPQKNYPRSIILAAIITFTLVMVGAVAIAIVIPRAEISLVAGLMDAYKIFFDHYHLSWFLKPIALLLVIGAVAEVNAWIIGPVKGLYATSIHGNLPPLFQNLNKKGMPTHLLLAQAIIVTIASLAILNMPTLSSAFWMLTAMSAQTYLLMYILMFISAIRLRYTKPHVPRTYRIPYKHHGMWILAGLGILACSFGYLIAFVPPASLQVGSLWFFESFLILGNLILIIIPLIIYKYRKPHWVRIPENHNDK